jgi:hypothetical protein
MLREGCFSGTEIREMDRKVRVFSILVHAADDAFNHGDFDFASSESASMRILGDVKYNAHNYVYPKT